MDINKIKDISSINDINRIMEECSAKERITQMEMWFDALKIYIYIIKENDKLIGIAEHAENNLLDILIGSSLEDSLDEVKKKAMEAATILSKYYESGQWLKDYELDERGELPSDMKRGVLSQDGIYNLLSEFNEIKNIKEGVAYYEMVNSI